MMHSLVTEVEARRKQCRLIPSFVIPKQDGPSPITFNCCASDCMAWRWSTHTKLENMEARPIGFCGLVGIAPRAVDFDLGDAPLNAGEVLTKAVPPTEETQ